MIALTTNIKGNKFIFSKEVCWPIVVQNMAVCAKAFLEILCSCSETKRIALISEANKKFPKFLSIVKNIGLIPNLSLNKNNFSSILS